RAAVAAEFRRSEAIGAKIGASAAVLLRDADAEQAGAMHVAEILDRKSGVAVVLRRARRQHPGAEAPRLCDQFRFGVGEAERLGRKHRGAGVVGIEIAVHNYAAAGACAVRMKSMTAASNACGASTLGRWPTPLRQT